MLILKNSKANVSLGTSSGLFTLTFGYVFSSIACAASADLETNRNKKDASSQSVVMGAPGEHFKNQFQDAKQYGVLIKKGLSLREMGRLQEALDCFKKALDNHAAMRNEQATASDQVAITLEQMGNIEEAAKYYDLAAELTMNPMRKESLSQKANELRKQSR